MMQIKLNKYLKVNTDFWIRKGNKFHLTKGKGVKFQRFEDFDLFAHKVTKGKMTFWCISDNISGCRVSKLNKNLKKLIKKTDAFLCEKGTGILEQKINDVVGDTFISPSYRFIVNPNTISYVVNKKGKDRTTAVPRRHRVQGEPK